MNESDERYLTAEDAIYDAFFLLLKEKSVDKITVSRRRGSCAAPSTAIMKTFPPW